MEVWVEKPLIEGETVTFRWTQSVPNPYQTENSFFYRYEGIDLTRFSVELFYEIFLSLQLRVFSAYEEQVTVQFPTAVPTFTAEYWSAYHNAVNVSITPISASGGYCPWVDLPHLVTRPRKAAVFFGGGKYSTLATCLFSEVYGAENVVLIQFVGPLRNDPRLTRYLEVRQEELMLKPARERLGVASQRGWTNYQAIFRKEGYPLRPHLELYTVGGLPALLAWGVETSTFTANWTIMSTERRRSGTWVYRYAPSRPGALSAQSAHYKATLGVPITVTNVGLPFHGLAAHLLLVTRYPETIDHIVPCTLAGVDQRWCYHCIKCVLFALSCMATKTKTADFDFDYFWRESNFVKRAMSIAESGADNSMLGNVPWSRAFLIGSRGYIMGCHLVAMIDLSNLPWEPSVNAMANLSTFHAMYGNTRFPEQEAIPRITLDLLGKELGSRLGAIVSEHLEIIDRIPHPTYSGSIPTEYTLEEPRAPRVAMLEHIRGSTS